MRPDANNASQRAHQVGHSTYKLAGGLTRLRVEETTFLPLDPTILAPLA